jgi:hypothetical protein
MRCCVVLNSHRRSTCSSSGCKYILKAEQLLLAAAETHCHGGKQHATCSECAVAGNERLATACDAASSDRKSTWCNLTHKRIDIVSDN